MGLFIWCRRWSDSCLGKHPHRFRHVSIQFAHLMQAVGLAHFELRERLETAFDDVLSATPMPQRELAMSTTCLAPMAASTLSTSALKNAMSSVVDVRSG
jgi:hypothetical protein